MENLTKIVLDWESEDNSLEDVTAHGCQSGIVSELITYNDTAAFYNTHKEEISTILATTLEDSNLDWPGELFGDKWDKEDPLALDTNNQNLLAWFGFEETANAILNERE